MLAFFLPSITAALAGGGVVVEYVAERPIPGAEVQLCLGPPGEPYSQIITTRTDAQGRYSLDPGWRRVSAAGFRPLAGDTSDFRLPDALPATASKAPVRCIGSQCNCRPTPAPGGYHREHSQRTPGTIEDTPGVMIWIADDEAGGHLPIPWAEVELRSSAGVINGRTDANGCFNAGTVTAGMWTLMSWHSYYSTETSTFAVEDGQVVSIELYLDVEPHGVVDIFLGTRPAPAGTTPGK